MTNIHKYLISLENILHHWWNCATVTPRVSLGL
nr:MAG TPA_asm: hypothetical protein [Caudoviricetes sp.]